MWDGTLRTRTTSDRVFFLCRQCSGLNARFSRCRGATEDLPHLPAPRRGQKSNGRGVQPRIPLSFVYRVPPLSITYICTLWFPTGWLPGRGRFRPRPGPSRKRKKRCRAQYSTPPEKSERNTIGPIPRLSPLQKGLCLGIIRLRCSQFDCCAEWSRHSSQARGVVQTPCGLPLNCVSSIILYHVRWKIKWFHILQTWYQPTLRLQLHQYSCAGGDSGLLEHGERSYSLE